MANWNPNSKKHKANHGGYRNKPSNSQIQANLDFWDLSKVNIVIAPSGEGKPRLGIPVGTQLKLNF